MSKRNNDVEKEAGWTFMTLTIARTVTKEIHGTALIRIRQSEARDSDGCPQDVEALGQLLEDNDLVSWDEDGECEIDVYDEVAVVGVEECEECKPDGSIEWACDCRSNEDGEWEID